MRELLEDGVVRLEGELLNERRWSVGKLRFDNEDGMGAVPNMAEIFWKGMLVVMTPRKFLSLAPVLDPTERPNTLPYIESADRPMGTPYLIIQTSLDTDEIKVRSHEGRHRMYWIGREFGLDYPMPVGIFVTEESYHLKAREIDLETVERISAGAIREKARNYVSGPLFTEAVWSHGEYRHAIKAEPASMGITP